MSSNLNMTLYYNTVRETAQNVKYPYNKTIHSVEDLSRVVSYDHVCAKYQDNYRKNDNFIKADCTMLDIDNTDSDDNSDWIRASDVQKAFPNVPFYVVYSRNNMKKKGDKAPRPKFHVYFPDITFTSNEEYKMHKNNVCTYYPAFDDNAKDAARFFFGVSNPQIEYYNGNILLFDFMKTICDNMEEKQPLKNTVKSDDKIPQGKRNSTLHKFALCTLTRWGDTKKTYLNFEQKSKKCSPPLDKKEIDAIWKSAVNYYHKEIQTSPKYISPEQYMTPHIPKLKPNDFTDVGQAQVFVREYGKLLRYSLATKFMFYTGTVWEENDIKAHGLVQKLTERQLQEACLELKSAQHDEDNAAVNNDTQTNKSAKHSIKCAEKYRNFILKSRHTLRISAVLKEIQPMIEIRVKELDADGFKLNTPTGTVDLRTQNLNFHNPKDYCTKITTVSPTDKGMGLFSDFLQQITCGDVALQEYLQLVAGMCSIGKVFCENLIIAYGNGRNGKSTFFNLLARVMGNYSGSLSAETFTADCRKNKSPEFAELRGKRLVIASELEEGKRFDTAIIKKLCSTDPIYAEKKYKAPFMFCPSHTIILYTNHLPRIDTLDNGTWRRLIVVPFNAVIDGKSEIKNYTEYLFHNAGEAVLSWIIEGAKKFIGADYKITPPKSVADAIESYRESNDWLHNYTLERCEIGKSFEQKSGELYADYRNYCKDMGDPVKNKTSFNKALEEAGYRRHKKNNGMFVYGLRLLSERPYTIISPVADGDDDMENSPELQVEF